MLNISNCRFAFLDLETTGLSPWFGDRVCEVGIVITEGKRIKETYQQLINPLRPLSPAAASTNRLTDTELASQPTFEQVAPKILSLTNNAVVVCHNARFDMQFLDSEMRRVGSELQVPNLIDTLIMARDNFEFQSYTLSAIAAEFGIQNPDAHRALADALTDKNIFFAMMDALKPTRKLLDDFVGMYNSPAWPQDGIQLTAELEEAIQSGKRLHIIYVDKDGDCTTRWVTPVQVLGLSDYIYLRAYCHMRNAERSFRMDRILEMRREL
jgi:DNA polymerase III subunit epsilon